MKYAFKPLFWVGLIFACGGTLFWTIFTITNNLTAAGRHISTDYAARIGFAGVVAIILSFILPEVCKHFGKNKND
ncbi:MAG: hypothetical protein FWE36_03300 [Erysipelotrichales bacterium]|nr:hypothetical protein [Erysipelotrichales bacterium]